MSAPSCGGAVEIVLRVWVLGSLMAVAVAFAAFAVFVVFGRFGRVGSVVVVLVVVILIVLIVIVVLLLILLGWLLGSPLGSGLIGLLLR